MATDRRRAVATASTGAGLTVAGGVLRQQGLTAAHGGKHPPSFEWRRPVSTHQTRALLRTGARGRKRYLLGATLGLVGAPALAVGIHDTVTRKRDDRRSFVGEGLRGTQSALEQRAEGIKEVPPQHKAGPLTVSAGAGLVGSLSAHRGLDRLKNFRGARHSARAGITALAGTTLAGASYPLARHTVRSNDYEVTPAGVRRRKKPLVRPSSKSTRARAGNRSFTADMSKRLKSEKDLNAAMHALALRSVRQHPQTKIVHRYPIPLLERNTRALAKPRGMGRGQGELHILRNTTDLSTLRHERAHLAPRRNSQQFLERMKDKRRRGREEARADYLAGAENTPRSYPDIVRSRDFREGYREVVGRMSAADTKRQVHKVHNPHNLTATTSRGTPRKVHWRSGADDHAVCGLDGAFGRGTGPFAEHYGEVTCRGCARMMRIRKADYSGRRTSTTAQRAAILAAGSTPVVGGVAGARTAGHFAPPGRRGKTEVRQYGYTTAGSLSGGLAGAYGTAALASRHAGVARATERASAAHGRASEKVRSLKPVNATMARLPKGGRTAARIANVRHAAAGSKLARPLMRSPIAAGVGYVAGKTVGGFAGSGLAMRRNQRDQREYNLKHPVTKSIEDMTVADRRKLSRKKRIAATSSTTTGVLGLGALAARAKQRPDLALNLLTGSAAIGGVNNLNFAGVLRREAKAQDPKVKKGLLVAKADHREPLTRMRADQAAELVRRHGDAGPLPSNLSRSERMQAYEARYVHAGGHKSEHWQRRADRADKVKVSGLAGATAGGAAIMALRSPRLAARLGQRAHAARHAADTATIGAATVSGAAELYSGHARRRRASYSNSKAGVAASALRRMKDYQP